MPVNINPIVNFAKGCVEASPTDQELAQLSGAIQTIENDDATYAVACSALLPDVSENKGRWVYVTDTQKHLYSNGEEWEDMYNSTLVIKCNLFYWGSAYQPSNAASVARSSPVQEFTSGADWKTLAEGPKQPGAIKTDGTLWSWGSGTTGELAMGTLGAPIGTLSCSPIQEYTSSTNWCYVLRTDYSSHAIKSDNTLWGWGCNDDGNLAIGTSGTNNCYSSPIQEYTSSSWSGVNGWGKVINALKTNGSIWSWGTGCGLYFGIGECVIVSFSSPVREMCSATNWCCVSSTLYGAYALKTDGTLWGWGRYTPSGIDSCSPVQEVNSHTNWCLVDGGIVHGGGIKTDGTLWSWGSIAGTAALGDGTNNSCSIPTQEYYSATNWYKYSGGTYTGTGLRIV